MSKKDDALNYHQYPRPGKDTGDTYQTSQHAERDLALAYSPGVAEPCLEIEKNPSDVYKYTDKGNLVAVISNGTAVLGLMAMSERWRAHLTGHGGQRTVVQDIRRYRRVRYRNRNEEGCGKVYRNGQEHSPQPTRRDKPRRHKSSRSIRDGRVVIGG